MRTIAEVVGFEVRKLPFVEEAMQDGLINLSSLARLIKPSIEEALLKEVNEGAIVMALKRYTKNMTGAVMLKSADIGRYFGEIFVRSGLMTCSYANSHSLCENQARLLKEVDKNVDAYCSFKQGMFEHTFILSQNLKTEVEDLFKDEKYISGIKNLCSVTVKLKSSNVDVLGLYYYLFKMIAWRGINVIEVVSTANEFTIVVNQENINDAFSVLMNIKEENPLTQ